VPNVTFAELQARVGRKLGILAEGTSLSAEDGAVIGAALQDVEEQAALLMNGLPFTVTTEMANAYADPVVDMAAALLVNEFGIPEPKRSQLLVMGALGAPGRSPAERKLRLLAEVPTEKLVTKTDVTIV
jgi:hypothetical protein